MSDHSNRCLFPKEMGKRNVVIVSSSDDDGETRSRSARRSLSKSKSRPSAPRRNSSGVKRRRSDEEPPAVSFDALCEDFCDGLLGFQVGTGSRWSNDGELWVDKYKPKSLEELAVHKKKVEEVKKWLKERLVPSKEKIHNQALVIAGPAGVGKSATINVMASHLGARLCEWNTPTPTLWQEHIHNSTSGKYYISKVDEFEIFVERIRKYPLLPFSCTVGSVKPSILLIDDVPLTHGKIAHRRLCNCLHVLAQSTMIPTVILITQYDKDESADDKTHYWEDLQSSLESAGACKITFNPLTINFIKKTLTRISREEQCNVTSDQIDEIAKASAGDIRHAITSLQYLCLRPSQMISSSLPTLAVTDLKDKLEVNQSDDGFGLPFGRDETISLFHALGKFLHNKRENSVIGSGNDTFILKERFARLPLKMDAPEKVLHQSHGQARVITDFLHENVLDFLSDDAMDDAWAVTSYLSDADNLLGTSSLGIKLPQSMIRKYDTESIAQSAAASVAVRGVLFGNSHPALSRWHAIRRPRLWQIEQLSRFNKIEMVQQRVEAYNNLGLGDISIMATEYKPMLKWVECNASEYLQIDHKQFCSNKMEEDGSGLTDSDDLENEIFENSELDDIEDW